jgi:hypothetical protein
MDVNVHRCSNINHGNANPHVSVRSACAVLRCICEAVMSARINQLNRNTHTLTITVLAAIHTDVLTAPFGRISLAQHLEHRDVLMTFSVSSLDEHLPIAFDVDIFIP